MKRILDDDLPLGRAVAAAWPLVVVLLCGLGCGSGASTATRPPLPVDEIGRLVEEFRRVHDVPAVAMGLVTPDGPAALFYGTIRRGTDEPPQIDTIFQIGSVTKTFTGTGLAWLSSRGEVALEDSFSEHLPPAQSGGVDMPTWSGPSEGGTNDVRLVEAATFTPGFLDESFPTPEDVFGYINRRGEDALQFQPGSCYLYSDLGWELLGYTLAHVQAGGEGFDYGTLLAEMLDAAALPMPDTVIDLSDEQRARVAPGYRDSERGPVPPQMGDLLIESTIEDMRRWLEFHMGHEPDSPLAPLLPEIRKVRYHGGGFSDGACQGDGTSTALGWFFNQDYRGAGRLYSKNGETTGYSSWIGYMPDRDTGVVVLTNRAGAHTTSLGLEVLCAITPSCTQ